MPLIHFAAPGRERRLISLPYTDAAGIVADDEENAIEAAALSEEKQVAVSVVNHPEAMEIRVSNTGQPIDAELGDAIYRRGVTTKGAGRGYGLALVAEKVAINGGTISFCNQASGGVEFIVSIQN